MRTAEHKDKEEFLKAQTKIWDKIEKEGLICVSRRG